MENCKTNFMCGFTACMVNQVPDSLSSIINRANFINESSLVNISNIWAPIKPPKTPIIGNCEMCKSSCELNPTNASNEYFSTLTTKSVQN